MTNAAQNMACRWAAALTIALLTGCQGASEPPAKSAAVPVVAPAPDKPQDLIVGKWKPLEGGPVGEFTKDGSFQVERPPLPKDPNPADLANALTRMKYRFVNDTTIEIEVTSPAFVVAGPGKQVKKGHENDPVVIRKDKLDVVVTKGELSITDPSGKTTKFRRVE